MKQGNNIHKIYESLYDNLIFPYLFYIPSHLFEKAPNKEDLKPLDQLFDKLFALETKEYNFLVERDSDLTFLLGKTKSLRENLFNLVEYKASLKPEPFSFLLGKYQKDVENWTFISESLVKDVKNKKGELYDKVRGSFGLQDLSFQTHKKELKESFPEIDQKQESELDLTSFFFKDSPLTKKYRETTDKNNVATKNSYVATKIQFVATKTQQFCNRSNRSNRRHFQKQIIPNNKGFTAI